MAWSVSYVSIELYIVQTYHTYTTAQDFFDDVLSKVAQPLRCVGRRERWWFGSVLFPPTNSHFAPDTTITRKPTHSEAGLSRQDLIALFLALAHALPTLPGLAERAGVPQR